ncbi:transmembrane protein 8B [Caerostris extrusa]|uniref:Transmembrane protein 8B n=1 Tax=Caerostris extrusa TaxID=172846 RepID=A0AAV4SWE5_CAEEX|nr:transmembrane protein 8B [Caerostris extrusa]
MSHIVLFNLNIKTESCSDLLIERGMRGLPMDNISLNNASSTLCWPDIPLIRISLPTNLAFEYNLPPEQNDAYPFILNISNAIYTLTSFEVLPTVDIGGTLVLEVAVSPFMNLRRIMFLYRVAYHMLSGLIQKMLTVQMEDC